MDAMWSKIGGKIRAWTDRWLFWKAFCASARSLHVKGGGAHMKQRTASIQRNGHHTKDTNSRGATSKDHTLADAEREAARILKRLSGGQAELQALDGTGSAYGLFSEKKGYSEAEVTIPAAHVEAWRAWDWIEPVSGRADRFKASAAGLSWLRRRLSCGDAYQRQHQAVAERAIEVEGVTRPALVNDAESPLSWLYRRKDRNGAARITAWQFQAGERLRADFESGHMGPRMTSCWEGAAPTGRRRRDGGRSAADSQDYMLSARGRVREALVAVGPELAGVVFDVCCCLKGLEAEEEAQGWPRRSGKVVLQLGLTRLARHYGLLAQEQIPGTLNRRLEHWGAEDYRPSIDA
jgi:hypothetical protein